MKFALAIITFLLIFGLSIFAQKSTSIRSIDFENFTYPGSQGHFSAPEYETTIFKLKNGKYKKKDEVGMVLERVVYGDVTGDGVEEAIIVLYVENDGGSAVVHHVYIYAIKDNLPKFLWGFEGGDRAWGGLRKVYAKDGGLVIELWGKDTRLGRNLVSTEATGLCCPLSFTRSFFAWQEGTFIPRGKAEMLPNPMANTQCPICLPKSEDKEWH